MKRKVPLRVCIPQESLQSCCMTRSRPKSSFECGKSQVGVLGFWLQEESSCKTIEDKSKELGAELIMYQRKDA